MAGSELPNIVLVTVDALRYDRVGRLDANGSLTPAIDDLAKSGITFRNVISQAVETPVSHAALFTARFPRLGSLARMGFHKRLSRAHMSLPRWLQQHGYVTGGFISAYALDRNRGFARGFDAYGDCLRENDPFYRFHRGNLLLAFEVLKRIPVPPFKTLDLAKRRYSHQTLAAAGDWLARVPVERPYFLFCHLFDTHCEYYSPQGFRRFPLRTDKRTLRQFETGVRPLTPEDRRQITEQYDLAVRYVDSQLASLFASLRARDDGRDTLVLLTADHGEGLGDHDYMLHGCELYDEEIHVPAVLASLQGRLAPRSIEALVRSIDLAPTLLQLAGLPLFPCDGQVVTTSGEEGPEGAERLSFTETRHTYLKARWLRALRTRSHKYIYDANGREELYDLRADPRETNNVVEKERAVSRVLLKRLSRELHLS